MFDNPKLAVGDHARHIAANHYIVSSIIHKHYSDSNIRFLLLLLHFLSGAQSLNALCLALEFAAHGRHLKP
jgi:hypothetical protein